MFRFFAIIVVAVLVVGCANVTGALSLVQNHEVAPAPVAPEETTIVTGQFENLVVLKCGVQDLHTTPVRELRAEVKGGKVQITGYQQNVNVNGFVSVYYDSFTMEPNAEKTVTWLAPGNIKVQVNILMPEGLTCN